MSWKQYKQDRFFKRFKRSPFNTECQLSLEAVKLLTPIAAKFLFHLRTTLHKWNTVSFLGFFVKHNALVLPFSLFSVELLRNIGKVGAKKCYIFSKQVAEKVITPKNYLINAANCSSWIHIRDSYAYSRKQTKNKCEHTWRNVM